MIGRLSLTAAGLLHLLLLLGLLSVTMPKLDEVSLASPAVSVDLLVDNPDADQPAEQPAPALPPAPSRPELAVAEPTPLPLPRPSVPTAAAANPPPAVVDPPRVALPEVVATTAAPTVQPPLPVAPKRPAFDPSSLSTLLGKAAPDRKRPTLSTAALSSMIEKSQPQGAARLNAFQAASLEAAIRAQVTPCWNVPTAPEGAGKIIVLLRITLNPTGALVGIPEVLSVTGVSNATAAYGRALAGSVRRAVSLCAPLKLPAEHYQAWREIELNFDASQLV